MKILYVAFSVAPFILPEISKFGGGISTLDRFILGVFRKQSDLDITVLAPADSTIHPEWEGKVILGDHRSKVSCGKIEGVKIAKKVFELADDYDIIFSNDFRVGKDFESWGKIASKCRFINHSTLREFASAFSVSQYQLSYHLSKMGAKVGHVQETADQELAEILPGIRKNPYKVDGYPVGLYGDDFNWVNMRVSDPLFYTDGPGVSLGEHWTVIGSGSIAKRLPFAIECWLSALSGSGRKLRVFTSEPEFKKTTFQGIGRLAAANQGEVELYVGADREEIFHSLLSSRGTIFPSISESMGLVALESSLCGTPVLFSHPNTKHFMDLVEGHHFLKARRKTSYIKEIKSMDSLVSLEVKNGIREESLKEFSILNSEKSLLSFLSSS